MRLTVGTITDAYVINDRFLLHFFNNKLLHGLIKVSKREGLLLDIKKIKKRYLQLVLEGLKQRWNYLFNIIL